MKKYLPFPLELRGAQKPRIYVPTPTVTLIPPPLQLKTWDQELVRILSFVQKDSLKRCRHCGDVQYRRREIVGPVSIDLKKPELPIIKPRLSNHPSLHWLFGTESYDNPHNWYKISPEVCCPNGNCMAHERHQGKFHKPANREGYRKFSKIRLFIIRLQGLLMPDTITFNAQAPVDIAPVA